jgi:predicted MFS family arabinose efflux permease
MLTLNLSRTVQGLAGGLITGGTMGVVSRLFHPSQRTRVLALYQGTWTICSLLGPFVGGAFAQMGWWRGSFWATIPLALVFGAIAWWKVPAEMPGQAAGRPDQRTGIPLLRLALLALGVLGVAAAGQLTVTAARLGTLALSMVMIWAAFRIDAREAHRLFPTKPLSIARAVGLGYWMLILVGGVQAAITVFMPLQLQIVYGLPPLWVGIANLIVSTGWTISTFLVSGWSGARERFALNSGPVLILVSAFMLLPTVGHDALWLIMAAMFVFGWGIGSHNVHLGARVMGNAVKGEESITAASQSMMRSLGGAIGTAAGGMVANMAGLGAHIDLGTVNDAILAVYVATILPLIFGVVFIVRMTRLVVPRGAA